MHPNIPADKRESSISDDENAVNTELQANASVQSKISTTYLQINQYKQRDADTKITTSVMTSDRNASRSPGNYPASPAHENVQSINVRSFTQKFVDQQRAYKQLMMQAGVMSIQKKHLDMQQSLFITGQNMKVQKVTSKRAKTGAAGSPQQQEPIVSDYNDGEAHEKNRIFNVQIRSSIDAGNKNEV